MGPMGDLDGRNAIPLELRKTFDDCKCCALRVQCCGLLT